MITIYEDQGGELNPDDFAPTALYDGNEWLVDNGDWAGYYPPGTPEDVLAAQLDGPKAIAVESSEPPDELREAVEKTNPAGSYTLADFEVEEVEEEDTEPWT